MSSYLSYGHDTILNHGKGNMLLSELFLLAVFYDLNRNKIDLLMTKYFKEMTQTWFNLYIIRYFIPFKGPTHLYRV